MPLDSRLAKLRGFSQPKTEKGQSFDFRLKNWIMRDLSCCANKHCICIAKIPKSSNFLPFNILDSLLLNRHQQSRCSTAYLQHSISEQELDFKI